MLIECHFDLFGPLSVQTGDPLYWIAHFCTINTVGPHTDLGSWTWRVLCTVHSLYGGTDVQTQHSPSPSLLPIANLLLGVSMRPAMLGTIRPY